VRLLDWDPVWVREPTLTGAWPVGISLARDIAAGVVACAGATSPAMDSRRSAPRRTSSEPLDAGQGSN
jgi:hypothetical protein